MRIELSCAEDSLTIQFANSMVRQEGGKWYVFDKEGKKKLSKGYDSKEEAMQRMREVEHFKKQEK